MVDKNNVQRLQQACHFFDRKTAEAAVARRNSQSESCAALTSLRIIFLGIR